MKLTGNTILITGGSAGIGLAFAKAFSELGNEVIITGRSQDKLDAAKAALPKLHTLRCDAGDPLAIATMAGAVREKFPATNVVMNNAGIMTYRNLATTEPDLSSLAQEVNVNVTGLIQTTSALIEMLAGNRGTVVNVSSGLAFVPLQAAPIYCATKAAVHSYTISLRQQLEGRVEVIELMPPAVRTELLGDVPDDADFKVITTDELVAATMKALRAGKSEICPGQASQLRFMSRLAPGFIQGQLAKGSKGFIPASK